MCLDASAQGEELRFQLKTTDELQAAKTTTEEDNKRLKREVALYKDKEAQYARAGHRKTREIRELTAQVQTLEKSFSQVVRDFEREREQAEEKHKEAVRGGVVLLVVEKQAWLVECVRICATLTTCQWTCPCGRCGGVCFIFLPSQTEELALEVNGLRQLVKLKNKELRTIKKLAQTILSQRTEVEQFFLDALLNVKKEIAASKARTRQKAKLWNTAGRRAVRAAAVMCGGKW